ncbi:MAG: DUF2333 family protein [Desulfobacterales bacterium]
MKNTKSPRFTTLGKRIILSLLIFMLVWPLTIGAYTLVYKGYTLIDRTTFPDLDGQLKETIAKTPPEAPEVEKGMVLLIALRNRLDQEMKSAFGWSVNDLWISPTRWLDNRANRQRGTIFAVRMLLNFYATQLSKLGAVDAENPLLKEAREKRFAFTEDSWWLPSTEKEYRNGIELMRQYEADLLVKRAVFNMRSDDRYDLLNFITGKQFLDQPLGLLVQSNSEVSYWDLDDRIYYTQGVVLVLRDFLSALFYLFPEISEKGGAENIRIAVRGMNQICSFDPLIVLRGDHDSVMADHRGKVARYLIEVRERLNDVAQSVSR